MLSAISAVQTLLASAVRAATQTGAEQTNFHCNGITVYCNVTAVPGADTVLLQLQEKDPESGVWTTIAATSAQVATGMIIMKVMPNVAAVAAAVTGITAVITLPHRFRVNVVHSGAGNFSYSLSQVLHIVM